MFCCSLCPIACCQCLWIVGSWFPHWFSLTFIFVLCLVYPCCQCLWIVGSWLSLRFFLTFIPVNLDLHHLIRQLHQFFYIMNENRKGVRRTEKNQGDISSYTKCTCKKRSIGYGTWDWEERWYRSAFTDN